MISHATIIGRSHRLMQQNCHDFVITGMPFHGAPAPACAFGLVLDGCGSKHRDETGTHPSHNEVGAKLLGQFTAVYLTTHLPHNDLSALFFEQLHTASCHFLRSLLSLYPLPDETAQTRFTATHLLCTVVGFVVKGETAVFFHRGDGYLLHNNEIIHLDSNNQPDYLAYDLSRSAGKQGSRGENLQSLISNLPAFQTQTIPTPNRLAVATDGWSTNLLSQLSDPQPSLALQRWLNLQAKERGNFEDDGAIATWWNETS